MSYCIDYVHVPETNLVIFHSFFFGCQLCPSQYRQLKAEGVPMIVKLRTGLKDFEDSDVPCPSCAPNASAV